MPVESEPGSPLSEMGSDVLSDLEETYIKHRRSNEDSPSEMSGNESDSISHTASTATPLIHARPKKRRRLDRPTDHPTPQSTMNAPRSPSPAGSISSDSSGSIPHSPSHAHLPITHPLATAYVASQKAPNDPDHPDLPPPSTCLWEPCDDINHANLDDLVNHINNIHIMTQKKKFYCAWRDCTRKDIIHTSAYALRAHVRSHTKEKPFMCVVPECDRSFTRSDALAKHMRTVHETEVLWNLHEEEKSRLPQLTEPEKQPKQNGTHTSNGTKKLKLTFKGKNGKGGKTEPVLEAPLPPLPTMSTSTGDPARLDRIDDGDMDLYGAVDIDSETFKVPPKEEYWPPEIYRELDDYERILAPSALFRLLRRQVKWATEESDSLDAELLELKTQTDDYKGQVIHEPSANRQTEDVITAREWRFADIVMERILRQEMKNAGSDLRNGDSRKIVDGDEMQLDGVDEPTKNVWQQLRELKLPASASIPA